MNAKVNLDVKLCRMEVTVVKLLFKARSQSLELNVRTYRWNAENSKECKGCSLQIEESVFHLIVECMAYGKDRNALMNVVKAVFGNDFFKGGM